MQNLIEEQAAQAEKKRTQLETENAQLKKDLQAAKERNGDLWRDWHELNEEKKDVERQAARLQKTEDEFYRERDRLRAMARRRDSDQLQKAAQKTRIEAIKALASMLPQAKAQAKKGKPALLRLILRSTR